MFLAPSCFFYIPLPDTYMQTKISTSNKSRGRDCAVSPQGIA